MRGHWYDVPLEYDQLVPSIRHLADVRVASLP
jgi:hypothetical protein